MGGIDRAWLDSVGGMLESVTGQKTYTYPYITEIGYDRFGQRSYMKHGNGAVTRYEYDDVRRLCHLDVTAGGNRIIDNDYSFDPVGNVTGVTNNAPLPGSGSAGGRMTHAYGYDTLYRLSEASGQYTTAGGSAGYLLSMTYDAMHRITRKQQSMTRTEAGAAGALEASYTLDYGYSDLHPFRLGSVEDISERKDASGRDRSNAMRHRYEYDPDGNLTRVRTSLAMKDGTSRDGLGERRILRDEENRMLAYSDNGYVSGYWYDAGGMRTVKTSGAWSRARIDGEYAGGSIDTTPFTLYVSPELVWSSGGHYTKHIYAGGERVVSKVGDETSYGTDPRDVEKAGCSGYTVNWSSKAAVLRASIAERYEALDVPYERPAPADTNAVVARAAAMTAPERATTTCVTKMIMKTCSSSTTRTTLAVPTSSPTLTAKWYSISSTSPSAKSSSRSATTYGTRLISSTRKNSTKRLVCTTTVPATTTRVSAFGYQLTPKKKNTLRFLHIVILLQIL